MIEKLQEIGIELKGKTSGNVKVVCPQCSHTRKKKNDPCLSVNIDTGVYNCHNNCGFSGGVATVKKIEKKVYAIPVKNNTNLSDKTLAWFNERGISKSTVMRFNLTESKEFMPQVSAERNCINFNYYRKGELVNVKFRDGQKNFKMVKGAELVFFNLDALEDTEEIIITEGEIDAMSFYESGIYNVISVPNGASQGKQKLEYLDNCWSYFENVKKIIIATDSDQPGIALREELARRLGKERCWIFQYPDECKDANDILVKSGDPAVLKQALEYVKEYPVQGVTTVFEIEDRINNLYTNGYPKGLKIGFDSFDQLITWRAGEFTAFTGIPGSGKSEFADQIMVKLADIHEWKWAVFSAENQPNEIHFSKLAEKYIGKTFYSVNEEYRINLQELQKAKEFINDAFFFVDIDEANITLDGLLAKARELVLRKGINGFIIDPWNYIEHKIGSGQTETQYISEALTKISRFCKINNVHIIVVAHPVKIQKEADGKYKVATMYDIAGSAHWFNKIDNGVSVYRDFSTNIIDVHVAKIRFKFIGKLGMTQFEWDKFTGRYSELHKDNGMFNQEEL
jgi:twinkle protein